MSGKIYTKTGDDGTTGLVGGSRVKKYNIRLETYGLVDELNALIGMIRAHNLPQDTDKILIEIQNKLFNIGSVLASDEKGQTYTKDLLIKESDIALLENTIDEYQKVLPKLQQFILPAGDFAMASCHLARTVCRRTERKIVKFAEQEEVDKGIIQYINRLSDFLFVLARKLGKDRNIKETFWQK